MNNNKQLIFRMNGEHSGAYKFCEIIAPWIVGNENNDANTT